MKILLLISALALTGCQTKAVYLTGDDNAWFQSLSGDGFMYCMANRKDNALPTPVCYPAKNAMDLTHRR